MSKLVKQTEDALHTLVVEALGKAIAAGELPAAAMPALVPEYGTHHERPMLWFCAISGAAS